MAEEEKRTSPEPPLPSPPESSPQPKDPPPESSTSPARFDPSRMIGIIKRKALIKDLAAAYHAECLALCRELLELQKRKDEPFLDTKATEDMRKETVRSSSKRAKKKR
ncbi:unnamed protein product [Arabidopsis lyrata]|uniref:Uncharacterized protein n=1 Tax=Arabidopsis lyrata subsp. lyrata TaxID=81972 RepID=D7MCS9_ARALL|nr:uncharacterized protein LOC9306117 [Arabidopsis lyrata subsp. lyrata]EFH44257.1 hypothetical protein ARALYDRAFT_493019 [Arabidopsis lyrata subsp. lyrata]CAH8276171.1 unnamed protein product [Arabidopsis lyrata]|eukprot:XP_020873918.1 uncharacterized protein LOC9306117 [Arabidopsis lyrata subsp. lyrata]